MGLRSHKSLLRFGPGNAFFARCLLAGRDWAQKTQQYLNNKESSDISQINNYLSREPELFEKDA